MARRDQNLRNRIAIVNATRNPTYNYKATQSTERFSERCSSSEERHNNLMNFSVDPASGVWAVRAFQCCKAEHIRKNEKTTTTEMKIEQRKWRRIPNRVICKSHLMTMAMAMTIMVCVRVCARAQVCICLNARLNDIAIVSFFLSFLLSVCVCVCQSARRAKQTIVQQMWEVYPPPSAERQTQQSCSPCLKEKNRSA